MRKFHRWVMTVFAVLFIYWSASGLTLAIYDFTDSQQGWAEGGGPGMRPVADSGIAPLRADTVSTSVANAVAAARALAPNESITAVELRQSATGVQASVDIGGPQARTLKFDAQTNTLLSSNPITPAGMAAGNAPRKQPDMHTVLKNWHRGNIVGHWGVGVAMFTGIALLLMIITGVWLYFSLWQRHRAMGRTGFFWR